MIKQVKTSSQFAKKMFPNSQRSKVKTNPNFERRITVPKIGKIGIINRSMIHENILSKQLNGKIIRYKISIMSQYKNIIFLGPFRSESLRNLHSLKRLHPEINIYIWWIGTDVWNAMMNKRYKINLAKNLRATHLAVSDQLKKELLTLGINSEVLTLVPNISRFKILPLPNEYTVAVYMPSQNLKFYHFDRVKRIIQQTPNIKYIIYGNKAPSPIAHYKNVVDKRWVTDTTKIILESNCLLRQTIHDGFPKSVIEYVCSGRSVICNHAFPYVTNLKKESDIIKEINRNPTISKEAIDFYKKEYTFEKIKRRLR